jgi:hypothetical protein
MDGRYYKKALENSKQHLKSFAGDIKKNDILTITNIILVGSSGIANNIASFTGGEKIITSTVLSIVLYLSLIVTGIQKYYDFSQSAEKHRLISILYQTLSENIKDENIPTQYIRSQYQLLRALGPGLVDLEENFDLNSVNVVETERDNELDFELRRMNDI